MSTTVKLKLTNTSRSENGFCDEEEIVRVAPIYLRSFPENAPAYKEPRVGINHAAGATDVEFKRSRPFTEGESAAGSRGDARVSYTPLC